MSINRAVVCSQVCGQRVEQSSNSQKAVQRSVRTRRTRRTSGRAYGGPLISVSGPSRKSFASCASYCSAKMNDTRTKATKSRVARSHKSMSSVLTIFWHLAAGCWLLAAASNKRHRQQSKLASSLSSSGSARRGAPFDGTLTYK